MTTTATQGLDELSFELGDALHEPGDPAFEDACTLFNAMIERRPALVARCSSPDDVAAALALADARGLDVAVRAGGHSVAGQSLVEGGLVLDVRGIDAVDVDPVRRIARVGGGAAWAQVDTATQRHGLATTGGRVSTTGVAGLTLGGGSGWLERKHGLACDNLVAVELVTAGGQLVRASEHEHPELFWALRGGGGNFGVVTAFEFRLHPVGPEVFGGLLMHPAERGAELLAAWRDVMRAAPDGLSLAFGYMVAPDDDPDVPAELRGRQVALVAGMHAGSFAEGEELVRPIRELGTPALDAFGPVPYADLQCSLDDPPGYRNYWTAEHVSDLPDATIAALHEHNAAMPDILGQVFIVAWGGAVARVGEERSPLAGRGAPFIVHPLVLWEDPADDRNAIDWGRGFRDVVSDVATGSTYANFVGDEGRARVRAGFTRRSYERLARVKADWDPDDRFRAPGHVAPAPAVGSRTS